jgi:hypothetical protein
VKKNDMQELLMRNLVAAMTRHFLPAVLRHVLADKRRGELHLFNSTLDYVTSARRS